MPSPDRLYELRTYHAVPGRLDALHARFRDHTMGLFARHGLTVVGFWAARDSAGQPTNDLVYLLSFPDRAAADQAWDAFRSDPDWIEARAASEEAAGGPLTTALESVYLDPTDYAPQP